MTLSLTTFSTTILNACTERHCAQMSFMLSVTIKSNMLTVFSLNVVAPSYLADVDAVVDGVDDHDLHRTVGWHILDQCYKTFFVAIYEWSE